MNKKVAFYTLGCRVNQYETTALAELFIKNGYTIVDFSDKSDLYIINTCAVTAESERKSAQMIRRALKEGGKVAVIGCYSQLDPELGGIGGVSFIGGSKDKTAVFREADKLLQVENPITEDTDLTDCEYEPMQIGTAATDIFSTCRAFVKIEDGCNGRCSYCIIPKTRGKVRSRPLGDIISEVDRLADRGYKEIVLTGIETSAYDYAPLSELIRTIDRIKGIERLRFGSLSPNSITDDFLAAAQESRVFMPHMHLSLQSGSDRILKLMRRQYNKKQMCGKIEKIYAAMPHALLSADLIVGFPTETEDDFQQTLGLVSEYHLSHVHAFPFSPRPGTDAAVMEGRLDVHEVKLRNEKLIKHSLAVKHEIFERKVGSAQKVLVEKAEQGVCSGHTEDFIEVRFSSDRRVETGDIAIVDIISHQDEYLIGRVNGKE
jgi:threonylcarbamoyladenosine tRNA methylthiotransferase MtaB